MRSLNRGKIEASSHCMVFVTKNSYSSIDRFQYTIFFKSLFIHTSRYLKQKNTWRISFGNKCSLEFFRFGLAGPGFVAQPCCKRQNLAFFFVSNTIWNFDWQALDSIWTVMLFLKKKALMIDWNLILVENAYNLLVVENLTGFYWVLLRFNGFYCFSMGFYCVWMGCTGFYWVSLGFNGFC